MRPVQRHQEPAKVDRGGLRFLVTRTDEKNRYFKSSDQLIGNAPKPRAPQPSMAVRGHHHEVSPDVPHIFGKCSSYRAVEHRTGERPPHAVSQAVRQALQIVTLRSQHREPDLDVILPGFEREEWR